MLKLHDKTPGLKNIDVVSFVQNVAENLYDSILIIHFEFLALESANPADLFGAALNPVLFLAVKDQLLSLFQGNVMRSTNL